MDGFGLLRPADATHKRQRRLMLRGDAAMAGGAACSTEKYRDERAATRPATAVATPRHEGGGQHRPWSRASGSEDSSTSREHGEAPVRDSGPSSAHRSRRDVINLTGDHGNAAADQDVVYLAAIKSISEQLDARLPRKVFCRVLWYGNILYQVFDTYRDRAHTGGAHLRYH